MSEEQDKVQVAQQDQPTPADENVGANDEANAQAADAQARANGGQDASGQPVPAPSDDQQQPSTASPSDNQMNAAAGALGGQEHMTGAAPTTTPTAYGQGETPSTVSQQLTIEQQKQMAANQAQLNEDAHKGSRIHRFAEAIAGGANYEYKLDPVTGEQTRVKRPLTGAQIAMGIIAQVLGGMGAGANAKNPADAIGKGFEYGRQQVMQRDAAARNMATDEWKQQVQTVQTNFQTYHNKMAAMKLGWDAGRSQIDLDAPLYKAAVDIDSSGKFPTKIVGRTLSGSDFQQELQKDPQFTHKNVVVKIGQEWDIDPVTGEPHDNQGKPAINSRYVVLDPNATITVPPELKKYFKGNLPDDTKMRIGVLKEAIEKQGAAENTYHAIQQLAGKDKDTQSERAGQPKAAATQSANAQGSVWAKYPSVDALADVMAKQEGQAVGSRSQRNNNPGNLKGVDGDKGRDAQGFAVYSTPELGRAAQVAYLQDKMTRFPKLTSEELINGGQGYKGYSPATAEGNSKEASDNYIAAINKGGTAVGANGATPAGANAPSKELSTGLTFAPPAKEDVDALELSAHQALHRLGDTFDAFRIPADETQSPAMKALASKQISTEDYNSLVSLIHSKDGKFDGILAVGEDHRLAKLRADVAKTTEDAKAKEDVKRSYTEPEVQMAAEQLLQPNNLTTLKDIGGMAGGLRLQIMAKAQALAKERGVKFDVGLLNERVRYVGQYENPNGSSYKNRNAINNMMQHGADLVDINNEYRRTDNQIVNTQVNKIAKNFGSAAYVRYKTTLDVLKGEAKIFFAGGYAPTTDQEKQWDNILSDNATPAQVEAFSREITNLGLRRADTFNSEYRKVMGRDDPDMITTSAREAAQKLIAGDPKNPESLAEGQALRKNLDKFASGGEYGNPNAGYKPSAQGDQSQGGQSAAPASNDPYAGLGVRR